MMHVVLGSGMMPNKELEAHLQDLWDRDLASEEEFWFLVQGKAEPTSTDEALMMWLHNNEIYYEMIGDGSDVTDDYVNAQESYSVKRLAPKVVSLMQERPQAGEGAQLLALFASEDVDAEVDRWLNDVISAVADAGYKTFALNDGMVEIDLEDTDELEPEEEPEEEPPAATTKAAAKKTAAKKVALVANPEDETVSVYTRGELEEMDLGQLKEIAVKMGLEIAPRSRMGTYIDAILGEADEPAEIEIEEIEAEIDIDDAGGTVMAQVTGFTTSAMILVIMNGTVTARPVTQEEALAILS